MGLTVNATQAHRLLFYELFFSVYNALLLWVRRKDGEMNMKYVRPPMPAATAFRHEQVPTSHCTR